MKGDVLERRMAVVRERLELLVASVCESCPQQAAIANELVERLDAVMQELESGSEQLQQQNEALALARQTLEEERERYRELFELAPDGYVITDSKGVIQEVNRGAVDLFGADQADLIGHALVQWIAQSDQTVFQRRLADLRAGKQPSIRGWELPIHPVSEPVLWSSVSVSVIRDATHRPEGFRWLLRDITERKRSEETLRQAEERYHSLFDHIPIALYRTSVEGQVLDANPAMIELLAFPDRESLLSSNVTEGYMDPEARRQWQAEMERKGLVTDFVTQWRRHDGSTLWVAENARLVCDEQGHVLYYEGVVRDITASKWMEQALMQSAVNLLRVNQRLLALSWAGLRVQGTLNIEGICSLVVDELKKLGFESTILLREDHHLIIRYLSLGPEVLARVREIMGAGLIGLAVPLDSQALQPVMEGRQTMLLSEPLEIMAQAASAPTASTLREVAKILALDQVIAAPLIARDRLIGLLTIWAPTLEEDDIPAIAAFGSQLAIAIENACLFEEVTQQGSLLHDLATRLAEVGEAERRQLALDLHDAVGQDLAALGLNIAALKVQIPEALQGAFSSTLSDSQALLQRTIEHIRSVTSELRPPVLDDYGLVPALRWYGDHIASRTGLRVKVEAEDPYSRLDEAKEIALFRIAQEALTNVIKHSQASRVVLRVQQNAERTKLSIIDDGVGFDTRTLPVPDKNHGWGLMSMRERATAVGGRLDVQSQPGKGTQITAEVPCENHRLSR